MGGISLTGTLPYLLPFVVGVLTLVVTRGSNKQAEVTARLTNQRADFEAVVKPLRDELSDYRTMYRSLQDRVGTLEDRLDVVEADRRLLVNTVGTLKGHLDLHAPDHPVILPRRVLVLLDEQDS